jgi:preprotein translocase subunit SecD
MRAGPSLAFAGALALFVARPVSAEPLALDILRATPGFDYRAREPIVSIYLRPVSIQAFFELTKANVGRNLELRIDGKPVTKTLIGEPIGGGVFQFDGNFTREQAREIADRLSTGASKVEVEIVAN